MSTTDGPWLSVIIPSLEPDVELARCIASIDIALAGRSHEIVLIVPGREVERARTVFPHAMVYADTRRGIYAAMNDGARHSRGRYLYFIGKDDILLPTINEAIDLLAARSPSALFCDVYWGDQGVYHGKPSKWTILGRNVCHQGVIYGRDVFQRHGPYLRRMILSADHLLNLKILWDRSAEASPAYLRKPLAWYSGTGFSVVRGSDPLFWRLYPVVMRRYVGRWAVGALGFYRLIRGR